MAEELDKKLREYIKRTLKQGHTKEQIRASLKRVGYNIGLINKSFKDISRRRILTNFLLALIVAVLIVGLFMFWKYYLKPEPLVFLAEQPREKFSQATKPILLMTWDLPLEAKQYQLINLTTIWKSQAEVDKDLGTVLFLFDKEGNVAAKYPFTKNWYPTSSRRQGYQYMETYFFNTPYLKPDTYYYKIGLWDITENRIFYAYDGAVLGDLTIKENPNVKVCGLTVVAVAPGSPADKAGVKAGDVIVGIDGKDLEFENVNPYDLTTKNLFGKDVINLQEFEINTENSTYKIVKAAGDAAGVSFRYKICDR